MAEIKSAEIERFLSKIPRSYLVYLICGIESGLVAERAKTIVGFLARPNNHPLNVVRLDGDDLSRDTSLLIDEALTISLFGGDRILWITAGSKNFCPSLETFLNLQPLGCKAVIEAGPLKSDSALKRACVKSSYAAVIECWPDGEQEIAGLIEQEMVTAGLSISSGVIDLLTSLLGGDRLISRSEIDKIKTFAYGKGTVTEDDVLAIVANASKSSFDQAIAAAFAGDRVETLELSKKVIQDSDPSALLTLAMGHALFLYQLKVASDAGRSFEEFLERGPRFSQNKKAKILKQLNVWTSVALLEQTNKLSENIRFLRLEPKLGNEIVTRALLGVAYSAGR